MPLHKTALAIFCVLFALVTIAGFWAAKWRRPAAGLHSLEEWGLAGRSFGTWITWFLIGGDLYTAYTVIAVPAALYAGGAAGFFAVPYAVIAYPYMMVVLPRLWKVCNRHGYVTLADFVRGRYENRWLAIAIAVTGILALMPYIALQLVGMKVVLAAMGLDSVFGRNGLGGEIPLIVAFVILAAYTYASGLRAPAVIAVVKDVMLYIMVAAALIILPIKLGGYAHIFEVANQQLAAHKSSIYLVPKQYLSYSTLAIGSAIALMLYPHTATAVLSAKDPNVVRRNAALLPAYSLMLGLIALLGFIALAAGVVTGPANTSSAVPMLFMKLFPEWFAGFCLAAIAVGALVPAAIMSIAAANLFTRNLLGECRSERMSDNAESTVAKLVSLAIKFGALAFVLKLQTATAIQMQLLGGIWMTQLFPSVVIGAFTRWFNPWGLLAGWAGGMYWGTWMAHDLQLKSSVYPLHLFGGTYSMYAAVPALLLNLAISAVITLLLRAFKMHSTADRTLAEDYV